MKSETPDGVEFKLHRGRATKLGALAVFMLTLPLGASLVSPPVLDRCVAIYEAIVETASMVCLVRSFRKRRLERQARWHLFFFATILLSLLTISIVYGCFSFRRESYPQRLAGDVSFVCCWTLLTLRLAKTKIINVQKYFDVVTGGLILVIVLSVQVVSILVPLQTLPWPSRAHLIVSYLHALSFSALLTLLLPLSLRTKGFWDHLCAQGFLFLLASDFCVRLQNARGRSGPNNWIEVGWCIGLSCILVSLVGALRSQSLPLASADDGIHWASVRAWTGVACFGANMVLVLGAVTMGMFDMKDSRQVAVVLFLFCVCWLLANLVGVVLSNELTSVLTVTPALKTGKVDQLLQKYVSLTPIVAQPTFIEFTAMTRAYNSFVLDANKISLALLENNQRSITSQVASQVAHDIRSPLAALNMAMKEWHQPTEETRLLMASAVARIQDIANDLLDKHRRAKGEMEKMPESVSDAFLADIVQEAVSEKRLQFRNRLNLEITSRVEASCAGRFVRVNIKELKRVFSNLLNNAVEAVGDDGQVWLGVEPAGVALNVVVGDTGKGMTVETVTRLATEAFTAGKAGGCGLGVAHARAFAEAGGSELKIASRLGHGSTFSFEMRSAPTPDWFEEKLRLTMGTKVVVADDDMSIHRAWAQRFRDLALSVENLADPEALIRRARDLRAAGQEAHFLVDFEFLGSKKNGARAIEEAGIAACATLVTSRFQDGGIRAWSANSGVKIIPKSFAAHVDIQLFSAP